MREINILHWCLIRDNQEILGLLVFKYNVRLEIIMSNGFDQLLPLEIALKLNQYK